MSTASGHQNVNPDESIPADLASNMRVTSQWALAGALIGLLLTVLYYRVIGNLVLDWWRVADDSHGFLVPLFAGYLVWSRREAIHNTTLKADWSGVAIIAFGLIILLLGDLGANLFLSRISIVILLTGMTICFGGWALLSQIRFALFVLLFAIPLPALVLNRVTFPLQILSSKLASHVLSLFDVPVLREGNVIQLSVMKLEVAEACSGIRSLMSLLTLAVFYGYFVEKSWFRRFLLAALCVPIAIAANSLRIVGTGLSVQYWGAEVASGFLHEFSGWVTFFISLMSLLLIQRLMCFAAKDWYER